MEFCKNTSHVSVDSPLGPRLHARFLALLFGEVRCRHGFRKGKIKCSLRFYAQTKIEMIILLLYLKLFIQLSHPLIKFYELCFLFKFDSLRSVWQINNNVTAGKKEKNELRISISNSLIIEKSRKYRGNEYSVDVRGKETGKVKT